MTTEHKPHSVQELAATIREGILPPSHGIDYVSAEFLADDKKVALAAVKNLIEQLEALREALTVIASLDPDWTGRDGDSVYAIARAALGSSPASRQDG